MTGWIELNGLKRFSLNMYVLFPSYLFKTGNIFKYLWSCRLICQETTGTEILQTSVICAILRISSPRYAGVVTKAQQWNFNREWMFLYSFANRAKTIRTERFIFTIHMLEMTLWNFWLWCTIQIGLQNSLGLCSTLHWRNGSRPHKFITVNNTYFCGHLY